MSLRAPDMADGSLELVQDISTGNSPLLGFSDERRLELEPAKYHIGTILQRLRIAYGRVESIGKSDSLADVNASCIDDEGHQTLVDAATTFTAFPAEIANMLCGDENDRVMCLELGTLLVNIGFQVVSLYLQRFGSGSWAWD